jgi:Cysteine sulfinate desulfinase/cysteine desulfurase and related enzymes
VIYLDYASTTPINADVLETFIKAQTTFFANSDSLHLSGQNVNKIIQQAKTQMANLLQVEAKELIMTSGATEANNLAIQGVANSYSSRGKHIITTNIEHASVYNTLNYLKQKDFEITYLPVDKNGEVNLTDLLEKIRKDTILISIVHINNEIGTIQNIAKIVKEVKKQHPQIIIHSDMAQSIGKAMIDLTQLDLATFSGHKFYAPKGVGILYKRNDLRITPILYGGQQEGQIRPGTTNAPAIIAISKAMRLALSALPNVAKVAELNQYLRAKLTEFDNIVLSVPYEKTVPHILHFLIIDERAEIETYINALSNAGICVSTRSTCHSKSLHEPNHVLQALGYSSSESRKGIRVSISEQTTKAELDEFLTSLHKIEQVLRQKRF